MFDHSAIKWLYILVTFALIQALNVDFQQYIILYILLDDYIIIIIRWALSTTCLNFCQSLTKMIYIIYNWFAKIKRNIKFFCFE